MKKIIIILAIVLSGCKASEPIYIPIHDSTSDVSTETVTEDPTWTVPAEAYWRMIFECDSNRNVILSDYESKVYGMREAIKIEREKAEEEQGELQGKLAKEKDYNRRLMVNISALVDSNEIKNTLIEKERNKKSIVEKPYPVPGPDVVRNSPFAKFSIKFFFIVLIAGVVFVVIKFKLWKLFIK